MCTRCEPQDPRPAQQRPLAGCRGARERGRSRRSGAAVSLSARLLVSGLQNIVASSIRTREVRCWPLADTRRGGRTQVSGPASRRSHYSGQQRFRPKTKHHSGRAMGSLAYAVTGIKPSLLNVDCIVEYGLKLQNCGDAGSGHIHGPDNPAIHFLNGYGRWLNDASRTPPLGRSMRGEEGQPRQNTAACLMQWPSWITADSRPGGSR